MNKRSFWFLVGFCLIAMLLPALAMGAPFLVSDANPGAEKIIVEINTVAMPEFAAEADGSLKYDLAGIAEGDFVVRAKAGNVWGWSEYSVPFMFMKSLPQAPTGLRVSSE